MNMQQIFGTTKPLIGVAHLLALPGHRGHPGMEGVITQALTDVQTLEAAGFDAIVVENDDDHPPYLGPNAAITRAFKATMEAIQAVAHIPVGLEILYDMLGTIELAAAVHAAFVRLDVFVDDVQTQYGPLYAEGVSLNAARQRLHPDLLLLTDVQVKHTTMMDATKPLAQSVYEAVAAGADGVVVTGAWTGIAPTSGDLLIAKEAANGSGLAAENIQELLAMSDGGIVASSIKTDGRVDPAKAAALVRAAGRVSSQVIKNRR